MEQALSDLVKISTTVGKDSSLVLGTFGNTSVKTKDGKYMYIKASGTALKDMTEDEGWRRMSVERTLNVAEDESLKELMPESLDAKVTSGMLYACQDDRDADIKPSVEGCFHAMLDRYVIHLHPVSVLAYACARSGRKIIEDVFKGSDDKPMWVPYARIGYELAKKMKGAMRSYEKKFEKLPRVIFLQNHGLVVSASSKKEAMAAVYDTVKTCEDNLPKIKKASISAPQPELIKATGFEIRKGLKDVCDNYASVKFYLDDEIETFLKQDSVSRMCNKTGLTPDEQHVTGGSPIWLTKADAKSVTRKIQKYMDKNGLCPKVFLAKEVGLFVAGPEKDLDFLADVTRSYMQVRLYAQEFGGIKSLSSKQAKYLYGEPVKKEKVLQDRISVVTGAGSGIGKSIAIGMARAGAAVALADIDTKAAEQTDREIKEELPEAQTLVVTCNVTDEKNVEEGFNRIIENWGGVDILVNAAGIAPPYPLVDMPVKDWRMAMEVNLTGYFLMAKEASRLMIKQGMGGSIINISSKSGLQASKNNTAYNASKAGELHIARGWALEMGRQGIRFNCVAPGNVFEGSKIWNEEYIKVCAKKYGIKPEEVIPFYVSRSALNKEIKGQDIADGVVFLCSDKARRITGQTLVIDAGQVMVR